MGDGKRSQGVTMHEFLLVEKALSFAEKLGLKKEEFSASKGWLHRWKKRYMFSVHTVSGESEDVTPEMVAAWSETTLPTILSQYKLGDIFNADEFSLFFQHLPSRTLSKTGAQCKGGKHSKLRLTGMADANALDEKLSMFVIGKSKKPRCFKNVKKVPCRYRAQKKSWMDMDLFEEWVRETDKEFQKKERKIRLIIDNCPAHIDVPGLSNIRLVFLPPNTTSKSQPMDQGVIRSLKAKYCRRMVRKYIASLDAGNGIPKLSILDGMDMLVSSWDEVQTKTIVNCFRKCGISVKDQELAMLDSEEPFKGIADDLEELSLLSPDLLSRGTDAEDLVDFDVETCVSHQSSTDAEIIAWATGKQGDEEEDEGETIEVEVEPIPRPSFGQMISAIEFVRRYSLFTDARNKNLSMTSFNKTL